MVPANPRESPTVSSIRRIVILIGLTNDDARDARGTHEEQEAQFRRNQADQNRRDSEA